MLSSKSLQVMHFLSFPVVSDVLEHMFLSQNNQKGFTSTAGAPQKAPLMWDLPLVLNLHCFVLHRLTDSCFVHTKCSLRTTNFNLWETGRLQMFNYCQRLSSRCLLLLLMFPSSTEVAADLMWITAPCHLLPVTADSVSKLLFST